MKHNQTRPSSPTNPYFDSDRLSVLQRLLSFRIDDLLRELGVDGYKTRKLFIGCCPVHGGDNPSALNLYLDGEVAPGLWRCNTRKCHDHFKRSLLGFVRGVLSRRHHAWSRPGDKLYGWKETIDWCCRFLECDYLKLEINREELEKRRFAEGVSSITRNPDHNRHPGWSRQEVRKTLQIPSSYYLQRGYSAEVLNRYDVGDYLHPNRPLYGRAVVPVYEQSHLSAVGFTGRSLYEQCPNCSRWHSPDSPCPTRQDRVRWGQSSKWYNHNLNKDGYLYNYWFAHKSIRELGSAIIVEGPGDVWRLVEAGLTNVVGLFGSDLSDEQQVWLEMSGALNLIILTDNDIAGMEAKAMLQKRLCRSFRLHFPRLTSKDVGEMPVERIQSDLMPHIQPLLLGRP
jgi:5S rRNA maturation endonuclease (ribonuclease M5)